MGFLTCEQTPAQKHSHIKKPIQRCKQETVNDFFGNCVSRMQYLASQADETDAAVSVTSCVYGQ